MSSPMRSKDTPQRASQSAVQRAAAKLRVLAMSSVEGALVGSEEDLMTRLAISRPTLRQAAALVAQEQLIKIRRGVNGGYFATLPSSMTVAHMAAIYLQSRDAGLSDIISAVGPIRAEVARMASRNRNPKALRLLEDFLSHERALTGGIPNYRDFLRAERAFGRVIGEISGNEVLALFLSIVYDLSALLGRDQDIYIHRPERVEAYRAHRNRMATAILEGDEEMAVLATKRCTDVVIEWMQQDGMGKSFRQAKLGAADWHDDRHSTARSS